MYFERRLAGSEDGFFANFVPFVGGAKDYSSPRLILKERFEYGQEEVGITVVLANANDETPQALLDALVESPANFEQIVVERLDALFVEFEARVNEQTELDVESRATAVDTARNELGAKRAMVADNASALHGLLQEQVAHDRCR